MLTKPLYLLSLGILLGASITLLGQWGYSDEIAEQAFYCEMVEEGSWPAYREDVSCPGDSGQRPTNGH